MSAPCSLADVTGEAMGKTIIRATDGPGFLVNRCNRPFGLEALRLLQEQIADVETIDRICRMEGAFRMGPFELMDLVGVDTGLQVARSFYEQSFGEPRWRPSPIAARYVAAGLHGRKTGRGYYTYEQDAETGRARHRADDPAPPDPSLTPGEGVVVIAGSGSLARAAARGGAWQPDTRSGLHTSRAAGCFRRSRSTARWSRPAARTPARACRATTAAPA